MLYVVFKYVLFIVFFLSKVDDLFYLKFRLTSEWNDPRLRYIQHTYYNISTRKGVVLRYMYTDYIYQYQEGSSISRQNLNKYIGIFHLAENNLYVSGAFKFFYVYFWLLGRM